MNLTLSVDAHVPRWKRWKRTARRYPQWLQHPPSWVLKNHGNSHSDHQARSTTGPLAMESIEINSTGTLLFTKCPAIFGWFPMVSLPRVLLFWVQLPLGNSLGPPLIDPEVQGRFHVLESHEVAPVGRNPWFTGIEDTASLMCMCISCAKLFYTISIIMYI